MTDYRVRRSDQAAYALGYTSDQNDLSTSCIVSSVRKDRSQPCSIRIWDRRIDAGSVIWRLKAEQRTIEPSPCVMELIEKLPTGFKLHESHGYSVDTSDGTDGFKDLGAQLF